MVSIVLVRTSIKTGNLHFFKMCQIRSELLHLRAAGSFMAGKRRGDRLQEQDRLSYSLQVIITNLPHRMQRWRYAAIIAFKYSDFLKHEE